MNVGVHEGNPLSALLVLMADYKLLIKGGKIRWMTIRGLGEEKDKEESKRDVEEFAGRCSNREEEGKA